MKIFLLTASLDHIQQAADLLDGMILNPTSGQASQLLARSIISKSVQV